MIYFYLMVSIILLASICSSLFRITFVSDPLERFIAIQLMGTTAVALLLVFGQVILSEHNPFPALAISAPLDVALIFSLLASITISTFIQRSQRVEKDKP